MRYELKARKAGITNWIKIAEGKSLKNKQLWPPDRKRGWEYDLVVHHKNLKNRR